MLKVFNGLSVCTEHSDSLSRNLFKKSQNETWILFDNKKTTPKEVKYSKCSQYKPSFEKDKRIIEKNVHTLSGTRNGFEYSKFVFEWTFWRYSRKKW